MPIKSGLSQKFFAAGYDIGSDVGSIDNLTSSVADLQTPGLDNTAMSRVHGIGDGNFALTSYFNDAAGKSLAGLKSLSGGLWTWVLVKTVGGAVLNGGIQQLSYSGTRGRDGSMEMKATGAISSGVPVEDAVNLTALGATTHASAGSETGVDQTAGSILGGIGFLQHVSRASGTVNYLIEDSTNNSLWTTLLTFTGTGGATKFGERKTVLGNVDRYVRATTTGTFTTAIFHVSFRRGKLNDIVSLA
jgi:hypothetical protein